MRAHRGGEQPGARGGTRHTQRRREARERGERVLTSSFLYWFLSLRLLVSEDLASVSRIAKAVERGERGDEGLLKDLELGPAGSGGQGAVAWQDGAGRGGDPQAAAALARADQQVAQAAGSGGSE